MALFGAPFKNLFKPLFGKAQPESVYAPYIPQAKEEEEKKRKRQGVLQFIFDRLSTGQYVVANLVDEILTSAKDGDPLAKDVVDTLKAMGEGVIGTRRGDWQEILKRRLPEGAFTQKPVFGENREGKFLGKTTGADVVGFLANIFLDPTTYISFGAAKGAEVAAKSVADDAAKILAKAVSNIGDDVGKAAVKSIDNVLGEAIEQASKGFKYTKFAKLKAADPLKAQKYVAKHMTDLAKVQDQVYRSTLKQARYMGANELKNFMGKRLGLADNLTDQAFEQAVRQLPGELQDIGLRALTGYSQGATPGATKLGSFFGKEFGVKVRTPEQLARTKAITGPLAVLTGNPGGSRATWDSVSEGIKRVFHQSDAGRGLSDAMWGLMNRGVIGDIRKKLNMGNKYQKYLRQIELDTKGVSAKAYMDLARKYYSEAGETNTRKVAQWLIEHEEPFEKVASYQRKSARDLVNGYLKAGVTESAPKEVLEAISRNPDELVRSVDTIRNITDELAHIEKGWAAKGLPEMGYIENYVPKSWRKTASVSGPSSTGFMKGREFTSLQTTDMKKNWLKRYTGWSDETINDVVDSGATDLIRDVDELMAMRIMGHAKAASRINMIEKFKELGIPKKGLEEAAAGGGSNIAELGLKSVDHPLLQDVLFDKDIADILERSMAATGKEMGAVQRIFANTTNWWRQLVTMTTGFHIRNFVSNNFTGFMKHGTKWFNTKYSVPALVGVAYATKLQNPSGWMDLAKKMVNIDERGVYKMLNKTYGQGRNVKTLKELIDDAMNLRVISESQQGMDPLNLMQKVQGMDRMKGTTFNPLPQLGENPKDFIIARGSRHVGNIVENTPRFESFLIDFDELAGKSTERIDTLLKDGLITEADLPRLGNNAQEYAALEAKKWFIDYENLSDFEKGTMKNVVPFYCVPIDSEILTKDGWKTYDEITPNETEVLAYDIKTDTAFWKILNGVAVFDYDGQLMQIKNKTGGDYLFTPDHKWPVFYNKNYGDEVGRKIVKGYELVSGYKIPLVSKYTEFTDGEITEREASIIGWLLTDGSMRQVSKRSWEYVIGQAKQPFVDELRVLLGEDATESIQKKENVNHADLHYFRIRGELRKRIQELIKSKLDAPNIVTRLCESSAIAMWEAMYKGDGTIVKDRMDRPGVKTDQFFAAALHTESGKAVGDAFQILSILLNKVAHRTQDGRGFYIREGRRFIGIGKDRGALGTTWYKGKIWCPEIEGYCWMLRRNGKHIWSSNTWIRHNIANQLSGIVTYPWIYSMVPKLEEFMKYEDPNYDESLVPDYMKQLGYFPVSSRQKNLMSFINPNLPFQDLARIPLLFQDDEGAGQWIPQLSWKEVKDDIVGAAHPLIKTVVEMIPEKGYDTWRKRDLDDRGVAPAVLRYFTVNPEALQKIDGVLRYAGFERGLDARKNEEGKLELNSKLLKVLENNLPWVRVFDQLFKTGLQVADMANTDPEFVQKIEEISGEKTEEDALNRLFNVLSWWGGFKQRAVNMTEEEQRMQKTIYSRAQALYNDRLRTPQEQQTRLTRSAKSNERIRKLVR